MIFSSTCASDAGSVRDERAARARDDYSLDPSRLPCAGLPREPEQDGCIDGMRKVPLLLVQAARLPVGYAEARERKKYIQKGRRERLDKSRSKRVPRECHASGCYSAMG